MLDLAKPHKPALADVKTGRFGSIAAEGPGVRLTRRPEGCVLHVLAAPVAGDLAAELCNAGLGGVRFFNPGQWFVVSDQPLQPSQMQALMKWLDGRAAISDQTHGRVRIGLSGENACDVLAKGTAIDLASDKFVIGQSAMTLIGHIAVNLARTGADEFELLVLRGFAESLWNDLIHMGLEYGVESD